VFITIEQQDAEDLNITGRVNMSLGLALSAKWQELVKMNKSHMFNSTSVYYKEPYEYTTQKQSLNNGINVLGN
jgi:7,8-dihydro-6-hydroxymethylpterin-pyrophosphokinase